MPKVDEIVEKLIKRSDLVNKVSDAFRDIGQPDIEGLVFVCDSEGDFARFESIMGIPVYKVPGLNVRGGLLLAGKTAGWNDLNHKLVKFQQEMEI